MSTSPEALMAILGMALVTLAIKMGGLLLADRLPRSGFAAAWLGHIPPAVMAALVAPAVANGGPAEWLAAAAVIAAHLATRMLVVAMAAGVLAVYLGRLLLGG